jgi:hypothetical protein
MGGGGLLRQKKEKERKSVIIMYYTTGIQTAVRQIVLCGPRPHIQIAYTI